MISTCEGVKDVQSCLDGFAGLSKRSWEGLALGVGWVACAGFMIYNWKIQKKVTQIHNKQDTLAFIIFLVALAVFVPLAFLMNPYNYPGVLGYICIGSLPYWVAKKVYPEKNVSIFR